MYSPTHDGKEYRIGSRIFLDVWQEIAYRSSLEKVVKATVFMKDLNDFAGMNEVYAKYFKSETAPARSTLQVARIPKDSLVEIEVVAYI